jgi:hypothetical protein
MTKNTTEWYEFIDDKDLQTTKSYHKMILVCNKCGALFSMKACGNRSLFPWFGYHPTDGNCQVVTNEFRQENDAKVNKCNCDSKYLHRVTKKIQLDQILSEQTTEDQARLFSAMLLDEIGLKNLQRVNELNSHETNSQICHTHDFTDANQIMLDVIGNPEEVGDDIWEQVEPIWTIAKNNNFYIK